MDGIIAINKPRGMTSHDVVFKLRKILRTKKVGHTGTLDPAVNGVLPICIGRATRVSDYMMDSGKVYDAEITIGCSTTTEDQTGDVVEQHPIKQGQFSDEQIDEVLKHLTGDIRQTPPMFSAVKVNGRKLYDYARNGETVERPSRIVNIASIVRTSELEYREGRLIFSIIVHCGKGTYIRTLATQIAEHLGSYGHMSKLTRLESGGFKLEDSWTLEALGDQSLVDIASLLQPLEMGLKHLPSVEVDGVMKQKILNGQKLAQLTPPLKEETVMMHDGKALAIYMPHPEKEGTIKARKVFN